MQTKQERLRGRNGWVKSRSRKGHKTVTGDQADFVSPYIAVSISMLKDSSRQ